MTPRRMPLATHEWVPTAAGTERSNMRSILLAMMKSFSCSPLIFLVLEGDGRVTPAEANVGVVAFGLRELTDFLNKGERFPEIAESKCALDAVGIVASSQLGACAWRRWASSRVSGGMPPRQGVHVFSARVSLMCLSSKVIHNQRQRRA